MRYLYDFEAEIIKGINTLGEKVSHNVLMRYLVEEQHVMGKPTIGKYLKRMINERKLIRTHDTESNNIFYQVTPVFWQYALPSDEEELRKRINQIDEFMLKFEKEFPKINLRDKVLVSADFYQNL